MLEAQAPGRNTMAHPAGPDEMRQLFGFFLHKVSSCQVFKQQMWLQKPFANTIKQTFSIFISPFILDFVLGTSQKFTCSSLAC